MILLTIGDGWCLKVTSEKQKEIWRKKKQRYRETHREQYNKYMRQYHKENNSNKKYRERNPEQYRLSYQKQNKRKWEKIQSNPKLRIECNEETKRKKLKFKIEVLAFYSNNNIPFCNCCSEQENKFLCIDHPNGDGARHRKLIKRRTGDSFYRWLKLQNFPTGYQVLCFNCNSSKRNTSICPHQQEYQYKNKSKKRTKEKVISHYSNITNKCNCCNESIFDFLTIDHIEKPIGKKLTGYDLYRCLIKNNFPKGFQVLCYNCNYAKGAYGICPHQINITI